jgi:hypothetical protein
MERRHLENPRSPQHLEGEILLVMLIATHNADVGNSVIDIRGMSSSRR